jgi:hypothetical protein
VSERPAAATTQGSARWNYLNGSNGSPAATDAAHTVALLAIATMGRKSNSGIGNSPCEPLIKMVCSPQTKTRMKEHISLAGIERTTDKVRTPQDKAEGLFPLPTFLAVPGDFGKYFEGCSAFRRLSE